MRKRLLELYNGLASYEKEKLKVIASIASIVLTISILAVLVLSLINGTRVGLPFNIKFDSFSESYIENKEITGVFSETLLCASDNASVRNKIVLCKTHAELKSLISKLNIIEQKMPPQNTLAERRFKDGYIAMVMSTDKYEMPANVFASYKYAGDKELVIVLDSIPVNQMFQFEKSLDECKQSIAIVFVKKELLQEMKSITVLAQ